MNKTLIIEGMHRSGSSLITQWLHRCGLHLGENFLKPGIGNLEGHFEDIDFIKLHEEFLEAANLPDTGLTDKKLKPLSLHHKHKLSAIINFKNGLHAQWSWKDPRTCLFLGTYRELIPYAFHLIITRDFDIVVNSLLNREFKWIEQKYLDRKPFSVWIWKTFRRTKRQQLFYNTYSEHYLKVWISYTEEILNHIDLLDKKNFIVVDYLSLLNNEKLVFDHIKNDWGFEITYFDFTKVYKEKLLSKPIDINPFIKDKTLIAKAKKLEMNLNEYLFKPQIKKR